MKKWILGFFLVVVWASGGIDLVASEERDPSSSKKEEVDRFLDLLRIADSPAQDRAFEAIKVGWKPWFAPAVLEVLRLNEDPINEQRLFGLLAEKTGESFGFRFDSWFRWIWKQKLELPPAYVLVKRDLYGLIDPRFKEYFSPDRKSEIRLDEVRWGGVVQNGIPPLVKPALLPISEVKGFEDTDVVFGLVLNGEARAYPRRILAWHELVLDVVGGVPIAGVYCTLCGSMIVYRSEVAGKRFHLGTSGFLYRSNKLMFDRSTNSLWSTLRGKPVIGPLVGEGISLPRQSVVTTNFGDWKRRHPGGKVLSLSTGFDRDYSEGAAYRDYFASPDLMFAVPEVDSRLKKKDEVLAISPMDDAVPPLAISVSYLRKHPVVLERVGVESIVILTDSSGASRIYSNPQGIKFLSFDGDSVVKDAEGNAWTQGEDQLLAPRGEALNRRAAHRAFWFGWYAAFPKTRLKN